MEIATIASEIFPTQVIDQDKNKIWFLLAFIHGGTGPENKEDHCNRNSGFEVHDSIIVNCLPTRKASMLAVISAVTMKAERPTQQEMIFKKNSGYRIQNSEVRSWEEFRQYSGENGVEVRSSKTFVPLCLSGEFSVPLCLCGESLRTSCLSGEVVLHAPNALISRSIHF
jgi:hypothetical protein